MSFSSPDSSPALVDLFSLQGRTALVVGGAGLLGGQISHAFAELGARVIIASRDQARCQAFADALMHRVAGARVEALRVDITESASIRELASSTAILAPGGLDILVNSGWSGRKNTFESISDDDWDFDIQVCLSGVFRTVKAIVPMLRLRRGNILTIASMYGHVAPDYRLYDSPHLANPPSYGAAKAGVIQLTRYLASFLSPDSIRANCISPGPFPFDSTRQAHPAFVARLAAKNPLNRVGRPYELKGAAALLCSDAGTYITGQNLCVDGGWAIW